MVQELVKKKNEEKTRDVYHWGTLFKAISDNEEMMQFGWKDNSSCLFQSTVHTRDEVQVVQPRKRPSKTSSKAKTARQPFGDSVVKELSIPQFVDEYNYNMNHVDQADQLRASYETLGDHKLRKGWKALFFWLLNMSLVNAYLLSLHSDPHNTERFTNQKSFRESVFQVLFTKSERAKWKRSYETYATEPVESEESHIRGVLEKIGECRGCRNSGKIRQILGKRNPNSEKLQRPKRTCYGCQVCKVPLCKEGLCWEVFHGETVEKA